MAKGQQVLIGCVLGAIAATVVLVVGAAVALLVWGYQLYVGEVCAYLGEQTAITTRLGPIESCEALFSESAEIEDRDTFVFGVRGTAGAGIAYVQSTSTGPGGAEEYQGILLEVDGERILVEGTTPPTR